MIRVSDSFTTNISGLSAVHSRFKTIKVMPKKNKPKLTVNAAVSLANQIDAPSLWMATQASIFLPFLTGSTRQYMMNGVPSFL
jgi:hypothetical protein